MIDIGPPRDEGEWAAYAAVLAQGFVGTAQDSERWVTIARHGGIVRLARVGGRVVAGAAAYRVAQFFGGREVPAGAVADVCVTPERRGSGIAKALMADMVAAMRREGLVVSPLWPSTIGLYRRCGWEPAGGEWRFRVPAHQLTSLRGRGEAVAEPGLAVRAVQRNLAAASDGPVVRPNWWWRWRDPFPAPEQTFRYGWVENGATTGFLSFQQAQNPDGPPFVEVDVKEFWAATPDATRGLLGLLGSHGSLASDIRFHHAALPGSPGIDHVGDLDGLQGDQYGPWMLRLVDVAAALEARGWPDHVSGRVALEVDDPFLDAPQRLVLEVEGGIAHVTPGGDGAVSAGVGALSAWYSGYLRAREAARLGLVSGGTQDLAVLDRLTGNRPVWLPDHF